MRNCAAISYSWRKWFLIQGNTAHIGNFNLGTSGTRGGGGDFAQD
jgi:hypothetical protein